jgi:ATP-dependent DNA helicase RecQ
VTRRGHDRLSTYGISREFSKKEWGQLARQFVSGGLLRQDMDHGSLKLTPKGRAVLKGETYMGAPPAAEHVLRRAAAKDYDVELFERLRAARLGLAREADVPPYVIFHDTALREMAIYYPQSRESLAQIQGVGAAKLERYGDTFLGVIVDYCRERGLAERPKPHAVAPRTNRSPEGGLTRREEVIKLYQRGHGIMEIAEMFAIKPQTVTNHLWESVRNGEAIDPDPLLVASRLSAGERERVLKAFQKLGVETLRPVFNALGESVPWEELHLLRLYYVATAMNATQQKDLRG